MARGLGEHWARPGGSAQHPSLTLPFPSVPLPAGASVPSAGCCWAGRGKEAEPGTSRARFSLTRPPAQKHVSVSRRTLCGWMAVPARALSSSAPSSRLPPGVPHSRDGPRGSIPHRPHLSSFPLASAAGLSTCLTIKTACDQTLTQQTALPPPRAGTCTQHPVSGRFQAWMGSPTPHHRPSRDLHPAPSTWSLEGPQLPAWTGSPSGLGDAQTDVGQEESLPPVKVTETHCGGPAKPTRRDRLSRGQ